MSANADITVTAQYIGWAMTDKDGGFGVKIPSNAHSYDAGSGGVFHWNVKQKDDGVLEIAPAFFETHRSMTIVVKTGNEYRKLTLPISGLFDIKRWVT